MMNYLKLLFFFILVFLAITSCTKTDSAATGIAPGTSDLPAGFASSGSSSSNPGGGDSSLHPGVITAGEWNDIDNWNFWLGLMDSAQWKAKQDYWKFFPQNIYSVQLTGNNGNKITDAAITIKNAAGNALWMAKTDNAGKSVLFPALFSNAGGGAYTASAVINGKTIDLGTFPASHRIEKQFNLDVPVSKNIDVMYVVDATGSMGDELSYLKNELNNVLTRAKNDLPGMDLRAAGVFYRDKGDDYLTKISPFTTDVNTLINFVKAQDAGGGGDFPEAVHAALQAALEQQSWSPSATSRLLFLVLDAPPHHEDAVIQSIQASIKKAAEKGIKIIPVTASGIDKDTEFMMRFMSIATNGTYVFITNDSGIGNNHLAPTVGKFQVEFLNDLMVRLIKKYALN